MMINFIFTSLVAVALDVAGFLLRLRNLVLVLLIAAVLVVIFRIAKPVPKAIKIIQKNFPYLDN